MVILGSLNYLSVNESTSGGKFLQICSLQSPLFLCMYFTGIVPPPTPVYAVCFKCKWMSYFLTHYIRKISLLKGKFVVLLLLLCSQSVLIHSNTVQIQLFWFTALM